MQKTETLIRTKLRIPRTRAEIIDRPRLVGRVLDGLRGPLTVIAAPAGFGKTTLAVAALARSALPAAWLSLDSADNQPGLFLAYLTATVLQADGSAGADAAQMVNASQPVPPEVVLTSLINDLDQSGRELALVFDDYHAIHNAAVHAAVAFLLEHQPQGLHLLIVTRSDPPLPLTRLRARAQVAELRAADLRFSTDEAARFLNQVMNLELDAPSVALLEQRTEGWIAGLQMAALSMRDRQDTAGFLAGFSGTNRYILDYLLEEVLASLPAGVQDFLLRTSILERLNAGLCAALTGEGQPESSASEAAAVLDWLDRNHLFVTPLDDERSWYRYHNLFADLLRARLEQLHPGLAPRLHRRASEWLEAGGMTVEAVNHALAAGDTGRAAGLVEQNTTALLARGELSALMNWITALPAELRQARPWLCIHQAYVLVFAGQMRDIPALLDAARAGAQTLEAEEMRRLRGAALAIGAMMATMTGQDVVAVDHARQALEILSSEEPWDRAAAAWALGYAQRSLGRLDDAQAAFEEQVRLARAMENIWTLVTGLTDLGQVLRAKGRLSEARALLEEALHQAALQGARGLGYIARMEAGLASILYEQNQLDAAVALLSTAHLHSKLWPNPNHLAYGYAIQARLDLATGSVDRARAAIDAALEVLRAMPVTRPVRVIVEAGQVNLALAAGGIDAAARAVLERWAVERAAAQELDESSEQAAIIQARVWLAGGEIDQVQPLMLRVLRSARPARRMPNAASAYLLCALAAAASGAREEAQAALSQALLAAEPGGHVRLFVDEGPAVQPLLAAFTTTALTGPLRSYARMLLAQFPGPERGEAAGGLVEPLSAREREVLELLAGGASNQEIATRLVLAPGTVKAHTASIYRKLDAPNRTAAVAKARALKIIE